MKPVGSILCSQKPIQMSLFWVKCIQSAPPHPVSLTPIWILLSYLCPSFPKVCFIQILQPQPKFLITPNEGDMQQSHKVTLSLVKKIHSHGTRGWAPHTVKVVVGGNPLSLAGIESRFPSYRVHSLLIQARVILLPGSVPIYVKKVINLRQKK